MKLASDMERYERNVEAKKRRVENCDRAAATSLLQKKATVLFIVSHILVCTS